METQASAPGQPQAQAPVHPIQAESQTLEKLTQFVRDNPDNDPHSGTDMEAPQQAQPQESQQGQQAEPEKQEFELDEETPFFELEYKNDNGVEKKTLSAKELREGWLAKQDYHRNIQKVKAQEAELTQKEKQAELRAAQEYMQRLEVHKQAVQKLAGVKSLPEIEQMAREDPAAAQQEFLKLLSVNQTMQGIEQEQRAAHEKFVHAQKEAFEQAKEKSRQALESKIKGWGPELYSKTLDAMVKHYGFTQQEVEPVVDARLLEVFHDARQYRQLQEAKPEISKKVVAVPKVIKPGSAEKPNPASEATQDLQKKLQKSGDWRDAAHLYLARQRSQK